MEIKKVHWKDIVKPYMGEWSLSGEEKSEFTIKGVERHEHKASAKSEVKEVLVLFSKEHEKGFIINIGNGEMIEKILGIPRPEDWVGKKILLFRDINAKLTGGKRGPALRVSSTLPKPKQAEKVELTPTHAQWNAAIEAIKNGKAITVITDRYILNEENKKTLLSYGV